MRTVIIGEYRSGKTYIARCLQQLHPTKVIEAANLTMGQICDLVEDHRGDSVVVAYPDQKLPRGIFDRIIRIELCSRLGI